ncbi:MAG: hypothetical protein ACE5FE_06440 [Acidiferrobacterales bacterium]
MRMDGRDRYLLERADPGQQLAGWSGTGMIDDIALDEACRPMATVYTFYKDRV